MFNFSSLVATPSLNKNVNFDPRKDLAPISMLGRMSVSLSVNPALPVKTLRELTDYALANPGKLNFASVGALDTLLARMLMKDSGIAMTQVNYKGPVQSMQDVMAGVIQIGINPIGAHIELAKGGRVRMLTVFGAERDLGAPDVLTTTESGFPGVKFNGMWLGLFGPSKMRRDRLDLIATEVDKALKRADVREKLVARMLKPEGSSPEAMGAILSADLEQWGKFAMDNGLVQATK